MLMLSVILALLLGWCTGGRLSRFEEADLRLLPLPVLAFACQQAMNALAGRISLPFEAWAWLPLLLSLELLPPQPASRPMTITRDSISAKIFFILFILL